MERTAYIVGASAFLPNDPVDNTTIKDVIGCANERSRKVMTRMLRINGIETRYYVLDPVTGTPINTNHQIAAEAVRNLIKNCGSVGIVDCLACATSCGEQIIPSHASMVHGELGLPSCEIASFAGVCCASSAALKYAFMSVLSGEAKNAIVTASEVPSKVMRKSWVEGGDGSAPASGFGHEFLRWMLSDGAAALWVSNQRGGRGPSLRVDWIETRSMADRSMPAMYFGAEVGEDGTLSGWAELPDPVQMARANYLTIRQDLKLLEQNMFRLGAEFFEDVAGRRGLSGDRIDHFLPHLSSEHFRPLLRDALVASGMQIDETKWFTNLSTRGNTGSAAIFLIIEELFNSGRLKPGERILCLVPESARFSYAMLHFTVV